MKKIYFYNKKFAFTLAETLIVMGIIGVVAALTLPNLNSSTGEKEKIAKVQKIYSELNDAMGRAIAIYGPYGEWIQNLPENSRSERVAERLMDFMKVSKTCGYAGTDCFATDLKTFNGKTVPGFQGSDIVLKYTFITSDGTGIAIEPDIIYIDIDGVTKGPNNVSKDIFGFNITEEGEIIPIGSDLLSQGVNYLTCECFDNGLAGCTAWVIQYGNMDYLKLDGAGKCPNGTQLSETVTSCK